MKKIVQKIIVAGIVVHKGKVLIIQRSDQDEAYPGMWELPSGKREYFEKSIDALKREVKEETGLDVKPIIPIHVFEFRIEKEEEIRDSTQISFLVKPVSKAQVKLSKEHQSFAWISKSELNKYNLSKDTKSATLKAFSYSRTLI